MLTRFLSSNWVAVPVLLLAAGSLVLLYLKGRKTEAYVGGALLGLSVLLIFLGRKKKDRAENSDYEY